MPSSISPIRNLKPLILTVRGQRVILDADLAALYGTTTKRLNEQVKRNRKRFPEDFMFQLTAEEKAEVVANRDHLQKLKFSPTRPHAFTEHGVVMAANVLNSDLAITTSVEVVRTFVHLRQWSLSFEQLARKIHSLEQKYDSQFKIVFDAVRELMTPPEPPRRKIGFHGED